MIRVSNGKRIVENRKALIFLSPMGLAIFTKPNKKNIDEGSIMLKFEDIEHWLVRDYQDVWDEEISHDELMAMVSNSFEKLKIMRKKQIDKGKR